MVTLKHPQYFEGILQLRDITEEVHLWVHDTVLREDKAAIVKEKPTTNGVDLYFSNQHYLQNLGRRMKIKFPSEVVISTRLFSRDKVTQKEIYRITVLFRQLPFRVGSVLKLPDDEVEILHVDRQVHTKSLKSGKKKRYRIEELRRYA